MHCENCPQTGDICQHFLPNLNSGKRMFGVYLRNIKFVPGADVLVPTNQLISAIANVYFIWQMYFVVYPLLVSTLRCPSLQSSHTNNGTQSRIMFICYCESRVTDTYHESCTESLYQCLRRQTHSQTHIPSHLDICTSDPDNGYWN